MSWAPLAELRAEHQFLASEMETLARIVQGVLNGRGDLTRADFAAVRVRAETLRDTLFAHRVRAEDQVFPQLVWAATGQEESLRRSLAAESREDVFAHAEISDHLAEVVRLAGELEQVPEGEAQLLPQVYSLTMLARGLLREHVQRRGEAAFEHSVRSLPSQARAGVARHLRRLPSAAAPAAARYDRPRVLVADGRRERRAAVARTLLAAGYRVVAAADGVQAWEALAQGTYDLAVLESHLPELDGAAVCRRLRERAEGRYVYTLLVIGRGQLGDLVAGLEAGADDSLRRPFRPEELVARVGVGERTVGVLRELRRATQRLAATALTDELTGLPNRRAILQRLEEEHARAVRAGHPLSLLLADLDSFKEVNDTYGHPAGDAALREFARRVGSGVRPYDAVGRFGGDEFLVVLPGATEAEAAAVARRLQTLVAASSFSLGEGIGCRVTGSFGPAQLRPGEALEDLLVRADQALYTAKRGRRPQHLMVVPDRA